MYTEEDKEGQGSAVAAPRRATSFSHTKFNTDTKTKSTVPPTRSRTWPHKDALTEHRVIAPQDTHNELGARLYPQPPLCL